MNYFNVVLSAEEFEIYYLDFQNVEHLSALREENPSAYFVHSHDKIYVWEYENLEECHIQRIGLENDLFLLIKILSEVILRQFYSDRSKFLIRKKMHVYDITIIDNDVSNNMFTGISMHRTFHLHYTPLQVDSKTQIGISISSSISDDITWNVADFIKNNLQYNDLKYDKDTGKVFINSKSKFRIAHFFDYASRLKIETDKLNWIQVEYAEINNFVNTYVKKFINNDLFPGNMKIIDIDSFTYTLMDDNTESRCSILKKPECYFYSGKYPNFNNSYNNRMKIGYNRPFSYDEFENRDINISIIYLQSEYENVRNFFKYVQDEFIGTFKIRKENFNYTTFEIDNIDLVSYQKKISIISKSNPDLVVVIIDEKHESLPASESPYYFCKSEFIKQGINTQEVQIQQIRKFITDKKNNERTQNYTDHNLALNIYAKLGGTAWTIKPNEPKNELVIGIGATTDKDGKPILGLTAVFRGDGKYLFGKAASVTNMDNYEESLEEIITSAIEDCINDYTINVNKTFYLVFHIFKKAGKDNEIKALDRVVRRFSEYSFEYTFVHIGEGHNFRFFTYNLLSEKASFETKNGQGLNVRGTLLKMTDRIGFIGLKPNNSTFLKIDIHRYSSYIDLNYTANQVYQFAEMSHTSYNKSGKPVTIRYPNLMAYFAEKLKLLNGFYLDEIEMPDNSLWFI